MSYILEALKKAQAERQIGSTPTIHAPTLASAPAGQGARGKRTPVIVAMALMATAIAGLAAMLLRQPPAVSQPQHATQAPAASQPPIAAPAPAATLAGPAAQAPAGQPQPTAPSPAATEHVTAQANPPTQSAPQLRAPVQPPAKQPPDAMPSDQPRRVEAGAVAAPAPAAVPTATPAQVPAPAPVEEQVQSLRDLPEPIQRAIPPIALGGYMYSKNPADRLLLIDKVLRREGEEVAPGLILEKLQPKQAIFGFRGYRYRVAL